jgi:hypothetical protein
VLFHGDRPPDVPEPTEEMLSTAKETFIDMLRKKQGGEVKGKK